MIIIPTSMRICGAPAESAISTSEVAAAGGDFTCCSRAVSDSGNVHSRDSRAFSAGGIGLRLDSARCWNFLLFQSDA